MTVRYTFAYCILIPPTLLMFDTVWWNSARIGVLFTYDTQATTNWPRPHKFVGLEQLTLRLKHN